jgi:hypothetical protein
MTTLRSRSGSALAVRSSAAAWASSRNFGSGSSMIGRSMLKIGVRAGASGQSHSMIRSKKVRTVPRRCRTVLAVARVSVFWPGRLTRCFL